MFFFCAFWSCQVFVDENLLTEAEMKAEQDKLKKEVTDLKVRQDIWNYVDKSFGNM